METITIPKREYKKLKEAKAELDAKREVSYKPMEKRKFNDVAFGSLKSNFVKGSSSAYVSRVRKSWRV